jgi:hypothetical protein
VLFDFFFKIPFTLTGIPLVFTDEIFLSVDTDGVGDGINSVGKYHLKIPIEYFHR